MTEKEHKTKGCIQRLILAGIVYVILIGGCGILLWQGIQHTESGEHQQVPPFYSDNASDYCFFQSSTLECCEFSLSKDAFLQCCKKQGWDVVDIEKTDSFIIKTEKTEWLSQKPKCSPLDAEAALKIQRYVRRFNPEHQDCGYETCKIDPTMLTAQSCCHRASKGYWYMTINGAGRGITVLYDAENERCYLEIRLR